MVINNLISIHSDDDLVPDSTKPVLETVLTNHKLCFVLFPWEQFHRKIPIYVSLMWVWKLIDFIHISQGPVSLWSTQTWWKNRASPSVYIQWAVYQVTINRADNLSGKYTNIQIRCPKQEPFPLLIQLLCHMVLLDDGNCHLTMPVIKGHYTWDALPHTFNNGMVKSFKKNLAKLKIYTMNLQTQLKVVLFLFTPMIGGISHYQCQWMAWRVFWQDYLNSSHKGPVMHALMLSLMLL